MEVQLAYAALALLASTTLQSAIGFGGGLLAVPILVALGFPLPHAVATVVGGSLPQLLVALHGVRGHIKPRLALHVGVPQWLGVPVGVLAMGMLTATNPHVVRQAIGLSVVVLVTLHLLAKPRPRPTVAPPWAWLAGGASGFIAGLVGMGGPPLVLYAMANDWDKDEFRAFLWTQFLLALPVTLGGLAWHFGPQVWPFFAMGVVCTPVAWLGTRLGLAGTRRWSSARVRIAAIVVLYAVGAFGVLG